MSYIPRTIEPLLHKTVSQFPAVVITGPRQAGKTTLLKQLYGKKYAYVSLEAPDIRKSAIDDPRGFLALNPAPVIFDEIQYAPDLLYYIKEEIDKDRSQYGSYILTGSQNLSLMNHVSESLAGRAGILQLLPLSLSEIRGKPGKTFPWGGDKQKDEIIPVKQFWDLMIRGFYPELWEHTEKDSSLWYASYTHTYLERDIRGLSKIGDLTQFQSFLRAVAIRSGSLLQISDIARDIGISVNTVKSWLSLLEATHQIVIVRPYFSNLGKRLVKTPKVYFTDVGMLCYLTGITEVTHLYSGPMAGGVMETFVFTELYKRTIHLGLSTPISFWRTSSGSEINFFIECANKIIPIEVKTSATAKKEMVKTIRSFKKEFPNLTDQGYLVYLGDQRLSLGDGIVSLPIGDL
jgi:uncharacterized protein